MITTVTTSSSGVCRPCRRGATCRPTPGRTPSSAAAVAPEPRRVVLAGIQRQPCCGVPALASEVPEQSRLAEPGWGAYQGEPTTYRLGKAADKRGRGTTPPRGTWNVAKSWRSVAPPGGSVVTSCAIGASLSQQPGSGRPLRCQNPSGRHLRRTTARHSHHEPGTFPSSMGAPHRRRGSTVARPPSDGASDPVIPPGIPHSCDACRRARRYRRGHVARRRETGRNAAGRGTRE